MPLPSASFYLESPMRRSLFYLLLVCPCVTLAQVPAQPTRCSSQAGY